MTHDSHDGMLGKDQTTPDVVPGWYYSREGKRIGPLSEIEIRKLFDTSKIIRSTLVWKEGMANWLPLQDTPLAVAEGVHEPPPLPASEINNTYAWIIAFVPLIGVGVERLVPATQEAPFFVQLLGYFLVYTALCIVDAKNIEGAGRDDANGPLSYFWLVPLYLYKRARYLTQPLYYFWTWIVVFVVSAFISQPDILANDTYWGAGIPPCNSTYSKQQVTKIFGEIPLVKATGNVAIRVESMREISSSKESRNCAAIVFASNGNSIPVAYQITLTEGNKIYYYVNLNN